MSAGLDRQTEARAVMNGSADQGDASSSSEQAVLGALRACT